MGGLRSCCDAGGGDLLSSDAPRASLRIAPVCQKYARKVFTVTTFGEPWACRRRGGRWPPGMALSEADIQVELDGASPEPLATRPNGGRRMRCRSVRHIRGQDHGDPDRASHRDTDPRSGLPESRTDSAPGTRTTRTSRSMGAITAGRSSARDRNARRGGALPKVLTGTLWNTHPGLPGTTNPSDG
jgi:hypothetical protein